MKKEYRCYWILFAFLFLAPAALQAQDVKTTNEGYAACVSEAAFDRITEMVVSKDVAALEKFLDDPRNNCVILRAGIKVYVVKRTWTGKVKLRLAGQTVEFWTNMEAVK
jgi:hypothetical protein